MKFKMTLLTLSIVLFISSIFYILDKDDGREVINISILSRGDQYSYHAIRLIKLAAEKEGVRASISVVKSKKNALELRESLRLGDVDVIWTATSKELESEFSPVKIPLYMGILGYRSCIVNSDNKDYLSFVDNISDLKLLRFAQGRGWSDIEILRGAGLNVVVADHGKIFEMVDDNKIDCFPRAIFEAKQEQYENRYKYYYKLHVDDNFLIKYNLPFYFFLRDSKSKVFNIINNGLQKAVLDGSYQSEVKKTKSLRYAMGELEKNKSRKIISIDGSR